MTCFDGLRSRAATSEIVAVLVYTHVIYSKIVGWLVRRMFKRKCPPMPSYHSLAIRVERYEK